MNYRQEDLVELNDAMEGLRNTDFTGVDANGLVKSLGTALDCATNCIENLSAQLDELRLRLLRIEGSR